MRNVVIVESVRTPIGRHGGALAPVRPDDLAALDKWYPRTMNIFGRANSPKNKIYREIGLKKRDNEAVRQAFAQEVRERCKENGLIVPDWKPDLSKMPMDAYVVG